MSLDADLYTFLVANVPSWVFNRLRIPQKDTNTSKAAFFQVSTTPTHTLHTFGFVHRAKYQFSFYSKIHSNTVAGAAALRAALNGYSGTMGSTTILGAYESSISAETYDQPANDSDDGYKSRHVEYDIVYVSGNGAG